jgi:putative aminopeptidase FrvX
MARFEINREYMVKTLIDLLNTPSPTGDTEWVISFVEQELEVFGIPAGRTNKGALVANMPGLRSDRRDGEPNQAQWQVENFEHWWT